MVTSWRLPRRNVSPVRSMTHVFRTTPSTTVSRRHLSSQPSSTPDGVGQWATPTVGLGSDARIDLFQQISYPHSLGLLYSAFTYYCGFKVNSGEYKLMGLAPYGRPIYYDAIRAHLIDIKDDGS